MLRLFLRSLSAKIFVAAAAAAAAACFLGVFVDTFSFFFLRNVDLVIFKLCHVLFHFHGPFTLQTLSSLILTP